MRRSLGVLLSAACLAIAAGCGATTGERTVSEPRSPAVRDLLSARRLRIPTITAAECPVASARRVSPDFGPALGDGPVYPIFGTTDGVLRYGYGDERGGFQGEWGGEKVLWVAPPGFAGPVLVRGRQLDGPNEVRFGGGLDPPGELFLDDDLAVAPSPSGWTNWPSYTRVRAPGCYAYQIDTAEGTAVIVFRAEPAP